LVPPCLPLSKTFERLKFFFFSPPSLVTFTRILPAEFLSSVIKCFFCHVFLLLFPAMLVCLSVFVIRCTVVFLRDPPPHTLERYLLPHFCSFLSFRRIVTCFFFFSSAARFDPPLGGPFSFFFFLVRKRLPRSKQAPGEHAPKPCFTLAAEENFYFLVWFVKWYPINTPSFFWLELLWFSL